MKIITAMIQPFMSSRVVSELECIEGFPGMTVCEARGFGRKQSAAEHRAPHFDPLKPKARVEVVARDEMAERVVETITRHAHTGNHGDGKIFVWDVGHAVRVQTGERDEAAV